jgi:hypothetical protein
MDYVNEIYNLLKDEINPDKYNEIIYEYCLKVKWDDLEIEKLGNLINKNVKQVRELAIDYFNKVSDEYISDGYIDPIRRMINYDYYINAYSICNAYNFDEEEIKKRFPYIKKELYYNSTVISELIEVGKKYRYILNRFKVRSYEEYKKIEKEIESYQNEYLEVPNPALLKYGIRSYSIGRTKEERNITLKYIYEKFIESEGIVGNLAKEFKVSPKQIGKYAAKYYEYNIANQNQEKNKFDKKKAIYSYTFDKLKEKNTKEEIISLLDSCGISIKNLKSYINSYLIVYIKPNTFEEYKKEEEMILKKLEIYSKYLSQKKEKEKKKIEEEEVKQKEEDNLEDAIKYISMFIDAKEFHSIKAFCSFAKIDESTFNNYVNIIKKRNQELYKKYKETTERNIKQNFAINASIVRKIVSMLKNGIEENGVKRKFDILDYYQNTKLSFDNLTKIAIQICSKQELNLLKRFIKDNSKYAAGVTHIEETIMKEKVEVNHQLDKNGMPIPGTGEIFDDESKIKIINYLRKNNIPLNMKTYTLARRRYTNGTLIIKSKNKARVLTKKNNEGENNE